MEPLKKRKYSSLHCPHCESMVSKSTWYAHHRQYYDPVSKQWEKVVSQTRNTDEENFDFKDSSHEEGQDEEFDTQGISIVVSTHCSCCSDGRYNMTTAVMCG